MTVYYPSSIILLIDLLMFTIRVPYMHYVNLIRLVGQICASLHGDVRSCTQIRLRLQIRKVVQHFI